MGLHKVILLVVALCLVCLNSALNLQSLQGEDKASTNINFKFAHLFERPLTCDLPPREPLTRPMNDPLFASDPSAFVTTLGSKDLLELLVSQRLTTLAKLLTAAGLAQTVKTSELTIFAPTDGAFAALGATQLSLLLSPENKKTLTNILLYHVLNQTQTAATLFSPSSPNVLTLEGEYLSLSSWPVPLVNGDRVLKADLFALNGVVHIIDSVLMPPSYRNMSLLETLINDGYTQFVKLINFAGLNSTFLPPEEITVFAPNDAAWEALDPQLKAQLYSNPILLEEFVLNHVINGKVYRSDFRSGQVRTSYMGNALTLTLRNLNWRVNDVLILNFDRLAGNGVYHEIGAYLSPLSVYTIPQLLMMSGLTTFYNALVNTGAASALSNTGPYTVFAPTNQAFANANLNISSTDSLRTLLFYHVVGGVVAFSNLSLPNVLLTQDAGQYLNISLATNNTYIINGDAMVITGPIRASNGVVYVIDMVLAPSNLAPMTIPQTLTSLGLTTLVTAVQAAGLTDTLSEPGITIFAPDNAAFTNLSATVNLTALLADTASLLRILSYHVVSGAYTTTQLNQVTQLPTLLQGAYLNVTSRGDGNYPYINGQPIVSANIPASNGFIQVIGQVLLPPAPAASITTRKMFEDDPELSSFFSLISATGADYLLSSTKKHTFFVPTAAAIAAAKIDQSQVVPILQYHMVSGVHMSRTLRPPLHKLKSLQGTDIKVSIDQSFTTRINDAAIIRADIKSPIGVLHLINKVLLPPDAFPSTVVEVLSLQRLSTFLDLVKEAEVEEILKLPGPFTLFAPSNEAIDRMDGQMLNEMRKNKVSLRRFVLNHAISSSYRADAIPKALKSDAGEKFAFEATAEANGGQVVVTLPDERRIFSRITTANLGALNGYVHVVDHELTPADMVPRTLFSLIQTMPHLSNFSSLLKSSGVKDYIFKSTGEKFTVFAPTNHAIDQAKKKHRWVTSSPEYLAIALQYHIAVGSFASSSLTNGLRVATTTRGDFIVVEEKDGKRKLNGQAKLLSIDMIANSAKDGGLLHIIDSFLLPPSVLNKKKK